MNLFIGNISPEATEDQLRTLFSEFGPIVSAKIPIDQATGLPRGFGFVEMEDKFHGYDAIDNLDVTYFMGSIITVKESKPKNQGGGGGGFKRGGQGSGGGFKRRNFGDGNNFNRQQGGVGGFNRNRSFNNNSSGSNGSSYGNRDRGNNSSSYNSERNFNRREGDGNNNTDKDFNRL